MFFENGISMIVFSGEEYQLFQNNITISAIQPVGPQLSNLFVIGITSSGEMLGHV